MFRFPCWQTVALDIEATGINRERDRIIQYGIFGVHADGERVIDAASVVDAETPTGRDPANIPGIRTHDVAKSVPLRDGHLSRIYGACNDAIVVIHNKHFDWGFIEAEFARNGAVAPRPRLICCTWEIARRSSVPPPHKLGTLCRKFGIPLHNAHNARDDAVATFQLFVTFANIYWAGWFESQPRLRGCWAVRSGYFCPKMFPWSKKLSALRPVTGRSY